MLVKNWMNKKPVTINADATVQDAVDLMLKNEIRLLPVLENDLLVGVVTDRDLRKASVPDLDIQPADDPDDKFSRIKIKEIMTTEPVSIPSDYTIQEAAEVFLVNKISGAPVLNDKKEMLGLITQADIFRAMILFTGTGDKGIRFAVDQVNSSGCIKEITDIIRDHGGRVNSVMTSVKRAKEGHIKIYITAYNIDAPSLRRLKEILEEKRILLYMMDNDGNERTIY
ncbi:MAG: CBS domain-containing protein [Deltaproteobacteria bacterium]|nr:CBS domain-containing protein [Deltaproteobacteria bacterium]